MCFFYPFSKSLPFAIGAGGISGEKRGYGGGGGGKKACVSG